MVMTPRLTIAYFDDDDTSPMEAFMGSLAFSKVPGDTDAIAIPGDTNTIVIPGSCDTRLDPNPDETLKFIDQMISANPSRSERRSSTMRSTGPS